MMRLLLHHAAACVVLLAVCGSASAATVVRRPGSLAPVGDALISGLKKTPVDGPGQIIDLSGDAAADAAKVARESDKAAVIFAVGPEAVKSVSGLADKRTVIALGVPNPARVGVTATYVSVYPKLTAVIDYASSSLKARRLGILYSPAHNREVVEAFAAAATARGMTIVPLAASSSGELVRAFSGIATQVDAIILTIDPLLFERQSLRFVIEKSVAAKKPTIGFLPELVGLGVTVSLTTEPSDIAAAAIQAVQKARRGTRTTIEVDSIVVLASRRSAELIGVNTESLGADQIR